MVQEHHHNRGVAIVAGFFILLVISILRIWVVAAPEKFNTSSADNGPLSFRVPTRDQVALRIVTAKRYGLDVDADEEWSKILPPGGHLVHIAEDNSKSPEPYTVTLFHQLKCLDIIRVQYNLPQSTAISPRTQHCITYLREIILCRPNLRLESVEDEFGLSDRNYYDTVCRDWTAVYGEAERNQETYGAWKKERGQDES
ncbi:hypothetical protein B0H17DRAFT_1196367 [Mycena rosella]|uniref:Uncharacterized protein n=1 Tax=Mycena rosella TaxID=1033263 RepID=A0AAD7GNH5_MYCRO|nr:hypothetical protein B0H17DRAFT_1196367 [Mycena rosella]